MKYRVFVDASFDSDMGTNAAGACYSWTSRGEPFEKEYSFKCPDGNEAEFRALRAACRALQRVLNKDDSAVVYLDSDHARERALAEKPNWLRGVSLKVVKSHRNGSPVAWGNNHVDKRAKHQMRAMRDEILNLRKVS